MKKGLILFVAACLVLCMIPSAGMLFAPTTQTTENRAMAQLPSLTAEDGSLNKAFFTEFEAYFTQHMALRNQMVYTDASIQTNLFQESNVSGVIYGTDGWLYYASTLDDYLGTNVLSDRQLFNLAHNFAVVQTYLQSRDVDFVLTVAPNKNTLYGEHMPYYQSAVVDENHSAVLLQPYLVRQDVQYVDLFQLFEQQEEVLYLKQDSHWNNKGACLVYNAIMDVLQLPHEDYSGTEPKLTVDTKGDLNMMLYSFYGQPEENYDYDLSQAYTSSAESVTAGWIVTENPNASGKLLMFRDSFADSLIPFFSNAFAQCCYSKGEPNLLEMYVDTYVPDCVVIEKVERNIADYLSAPPILTAPQAAVPNVYTIATTDSSLQVAISQNHTGYYAFSGTVDPSRLEADARILVCVNGQTYESYHTGENGFLLYLKRDMLPESADVQVYLVSSNGCIQALSTQLILPND